MSLAVEGDRSIWEATCRERLRSRPFKFVDEDDVESGRQLLATYAGLIGGPVGFVLVTVRYTGPDQTELELHVEVQGENPLQAFLSGRSTRVMVNHLRRNLLRP